MDQQLNFVFVTLSAMYPLASRQGRLCWSFHAHNEEVPKCRISHTTAEPNASGSSILCLGIVVRFRTQALVMAVYVYRWITYQEGGRYGTTSEQLREHSFDRVIREGR
jgi:hypothetical protein